MTECVFCTLPETDILMENEMTLAFYDKFPVNEGHVLIIPKRHIEGLFEATQEEILSIWKLLEEVKGELNKRYHPDGYNIGVNIGTASGQTIFHMHVHVIPRYDGDVVDPRGGIRNVKESLVPYVGEGEVMKEVTAAIILRDNRVLIAQRAPGYKLAGKWEFPGGKIEIGETPQECLKREIREELDVDIEVLDFFGESIYSYHSGTINLRAFWCKRISGEFTLKVHSNLAWVNGQELDLYDFAPADIPLMEKLKKVRILLI